MYPIEYIPVKEYITAVGRDVLALAGGGVSTATTPCTIPAGTAPGTYFLIGVADGGGAVQETNETNNAAAVSIRIS